MIMAGDRQQLAGRTF